MISVAESGQDVGKIRTKCETRQLECIKKKSSGIRTQPIWIKTVLLLMQDLKSRFRTQPFRKMS